MYQRLDLELNCWIVEFLDSKLHQSVQIPVHSPTTVTMATAAKMATPSIQSRLARPVARPAPRPIDSCKQNKPNRQCHNFYHLQQTTTDSDISGRKYDDTEHIYMPAPVDISLHIYLCVQMWETYDGEICQCTRAHRFGCDGCSFWWKKCGITLLQLCVLLQTSLKDVLN